MEMPELNEDLLEGAETSNELQNPAEPEGDDDLDSVVPQQEGVEPVVPQEEEDTLDGTDLPKDDTGEIPAPEEDTTEIREPEEPDEPQSKMIKLDELSPEAEKMELGDQELPEEDKKDDAVEEKPVISTPDGTQPDTDMLSTLASAALNQDEKPEKPAVEAAPSPIKDEPTGVKKRSEQWHTVGTFETNTATVVDYLANSVNGDDPVDLNTINVGGRRISLEPGTAYRLRVCAVNSCGAGPWSEVAAFKTTLPGFPGAPSAIKISKSQDGAHLTWEPPGGNSGEILEYAVYLAVRSASQGSHPVTTTQAQLAFVRVFCGPTNKCIVGPNSLQAAHIDVTTKPAIIFRIAARNAKGYGPATQVRWLQESANAPLGGASMAGKRVK